MVKVDLLNCIRKKIRNPQQMKISEMYYSMIILVPAVTYISAYSILFSVSNEICAVKYHLMLNDSRDS